LSDKNKSLEAESTPGSLKEWERFVYLSHSLI